MTDNVIISIKGKQLYAESGPDEMELVTAGVLRREGEGRYTISYQESELTGLEGTTTVVQVDGGRVTLLREGSINSQMVFEEGERHLSMYETPYGSLSIGIVTRRMRSTLGEAGGDLEIDYAIEIDHLVAGQNMFRMNVKKDPAITQ
ncbi:DUF1934 domain-containing protein [Pseudoflavonifractor sp. An85]|uniref:DUF1934 domain-containing protein n=1 Tax=Pseudoflavonifractor sp. An85 TaxID=1965661 RepID=UPI000B36ECD0|nr:DUF1934 domain-containing protein [Pseudoflavonifractor sp. An85]OUN25512.1 hypothetical protein B5G37_03130 [Pseudoflavonifractor sp. An85]